MSENVLETLKSAIFLAGFLARCFRLVRCCVELIVTLGSVVLMFLPQHYHTRKQIVTLSLVTFIESSIRDG
jgi:hypothetical protein